MALRSPLSREQRRVVKELGLREAWVTDLADAGCGVDTAITLLTARMRTAAGVRHLQDDIDLLVFLNDPQLLERAIITQTDTGVLDANLRNGWLTPAHVTEALDAGIDPNVVHPWVAAGRDVSDLARQVSSLPRFDHRTIVKALLSGATSSDLEWLRVNDVTLSAEAFADIERGYPSENDGTTRFSRLREDQRRLGLVLIARHDFNVRAVLALTAALGDASWLDTLTRFVLDGTLVDDAIELARADHRVEQARTITMARTAGDRQAPAVPGSPGH